MKLLCIMMVRDGAAFLERMLSNASSFCDEIYAIEDRSTDATAAILDKCRRLTNIFHVTAKREHGPWAFSEAQHLGLLFRMAEYSSADWIVSMDADDLIEPPDKVRHVLSQFDDKIAAVSIPVVSSWSDSMYPLMVPLMGKATSLQGRFWRNAPGLQATTQRLHGTRLPINISERGDTVHCDSIQCIHAGWDSLSARIEKARQYYVIDPTCELNHGVPYDRGLLFGYALDEIDALISEYHRRIRTHG